MKVGIFTPYSLNPMHPRTGMFLALFSEQGIESGIEHSEAKPGIFLSVISKAFINIFDFKSVWILSKEVKKYDYIFIQDLKYLPLAIRAKLAGKRVVYETLDNSVFIRVWSQHENLFYPVIKFLTPLFCFIERTIASLCTNTIIVNSLALKKYFKDKAQLIYYASPFEAEGIVNQPLKEPAFLYLGAISYDKGFREIVSLMDQFRIKTFFFGDSPNNEIRAALKNNPLTVWKERMNSDKLKSEIRSISGDYFLIGLSLIHPIHYSYATQEANKEIDYLAMGIPFIGNHRQTTMEKIIAGCGSFIDDTEGILEMIRDPECRKNKSDISRKYYEANYAAKFFTAGITRIFKSS